MTIEERFWSKVEYVANRSDGDWCWEWTGLIGSRGYGSFYKDGTMRRATRVAWELVYGSPVPTNLYVLHRCDNPRCVRPEHLFLGTQSDNLNDAYRKGRGRVPALQPWTGPLSGSCPNGHPRTLANTKRSRTGGRICATCQKATSRRWYLAKKARRG